MTPIQKYMMATFVRMRRGVGIIGLVFPFLLWGGGFWMYGLPLADSMSAYYHANQNCLSAARPSACRALECSDPTNLDTCKIKSPPSGIGLMRNWFVGILFVMGTCLYLIQGFSDWENILLNCAGVLAVCVAIFPMPWTTERVTIFPIHYVSAVTFFILIAFVCLFCSGKTLKYMPAAEDRDKVITKYKNAYRFLSFCMVLSPVLAISFNYVTRQSSKGFWMEAFGIWAFGAYWLVKTAELKRSGIERRAIRGEIDINPKQFR